VGTQPYCVGLRNGLIRRNIYNRSAGTLPIESAQDPIGNIISAKLKDWNAAKAIDNSPNTFWRSMPQPDPRGVVNLYLDIRASDGSAQLIDSLYLDPVYAGQALNIYYSNDENTGTLKLSPISATATVRTNATWTPGTGLSDTSPPGGTSDYQFHLTQGPLVNRDAWIGIEWAPDFNPGYSNAQQQIAITGTPNAGTFTLSFGGYTTVPIAYDASPLTLQNALTALPSIGPGNLIVVAGLAGGPWTVLFQNNLGSQPLATMTADATALGPPYGVTVTTTAPGGTAGGPPNNPILLRVTPDTWVFDQFAPEIFYDVGAGEITLQLTDGTSVQSYPCLLSPLPQQYQRCRIVVGWTYDTGTPHVYLSVTVPSGASLGLLDSDEPGFPSQIILNGTVGFHDFRGLLTANVIKLENYAVGAPSFAANPSVYVSPDPVIPDANGNIPATTLDNAIYAAAWALQTEGTGGPDSSAFSRKAWTPIWRDYIAQKGKLFFPQQISAKYLDLEFTNLTPEPYPVYDSGIQTMYQVFPVSVTQTVTTSGPQPTGIEGLLTLGADVLLTGLGSVNWLNPSTVNNAINSMYGQTVSPLTVTTGPGQTTTSLPSATTDSLSTQTTTEVSSPWVYNRQPISAIALAAQTINVATQSPVLQSVGSALQASSLVPLANALSGIISPAAEAVTALGNSFTALLNNAAAPTTLPQQGADWWVFPGATLRLPAVVMNGLTTLTDVITGQTSTTTTRYRFNTTSVHSYDVRTVTRDVAVGYFAGLREVCPYVTTYIAELDPDVFAFSVYDPSQWVCTNTASLPTGPITTASGIYEIENSNFDTDISNWIQQNGTWSFDPTIGHWYLGTATVMADGTVKTLVSSYMDVTPGLHLDASVWVHWAGLTAPAGSTAIQLQALYYHMGPGQDENTASYVSNQVVGLSYSPWAASTPPNSGGNVWAQIMASLADGTKFTVPTGVNVMRLALVVDPAVTAGQVWFDTVEIGTTDATEGIMFKDFITTSSFNKVSCVFTDTGLVRSDEMWAQADPFDTNIGSTSLAYYTSLIPDQVPAGMWADTFADWSDQLIVWGEPRAVVAISVDPDRTFQGKRVLHFTRASGAGVAGVKIRQQTNFVASGMCRISAIYYKPNTNNNQVTVDLRRISDGVYIYQETFTPQVGYWYEYSTAFFELPDTDDQQYSVEFVCSGDDADEMYLNDLWVDIGQIRYFVRLGSIGTAELLDVTPLRYAGLAIVSCTEPVTEFSVEVVILSPHSYAYGMSATPNYLG
jgi:hypothetical protein